jgi:hypothetical protein
MGVSEQAIYTRRKRFAGFQASDVRRLWQLMAENARLKKLLDLAGRLIPAIFCPPID